MDMNDDICFEDTFLSASRRRNNKNSQRELATENNVVVADARYLDAGRHQPELALLTLNNQRVLKRIFLKRTPFTAS